MLHDGRLLVWKMDLAVMRSQPWLGIGIGRGYKFLRLSHHVSSEEKQQNNQAFVFQKHSVVICSVLQLSLIHICRFSSS